MHKKYYYILGALFVMFIMLSISVSFSATAPTCTKHLILKPKMAQLSDTTTCTKNGTITYYCRICKIAGKSTTQKVSQSAYGHTWKLTASDGHKCSRCNTEMAGHYFRGTKCIVCNKVLRIESMSPNLSPISGYRAVPYDNPTYATSVTITFNAVPYDANGNLMKVTATSTRYVARNALYHWGEDVDDSIKRNVYPPYYRNGAGIDERSTSSNSVSGSGKNYRIALSSGGKFILRVYTNGNLTGGARRYKNGNTPGDETPTPSKPSELTIRHINKDNGKEIIDSQYTKKVKMSKEGTKVFSLPAGEGIYKQLTNVSYSIGNGSEQSATSDRQYIVNVPYSSSDLTITFYYHEPTLNIRHIVENTGEEILDSEYTKSVSMKNPSTPAFSLDTENKYPTLTLVGYAIDGVRTNVETGSQYVVNVPWNGSGRSIIFYYRYGATNIKVSVKHLDISTGKLMNGTKETLYDNSNIPVSVSSLNLSDYKDYENVGVYMDGKYEEKFGTSIYAMAVDTSGIDYSRTYSIIFYYTKTNDGRDLISHEVMDPIPSELSPEEVAKIASNTMNGEIYEVKDSIPTSENVYATVRVYNYLFRYGYKKITKNSTSVVTFIQPYICNGKTTNVSTSYEVPVKTEYYKLAYLEVYSVESATLVNKVLPGESVKLVPNSSTMPSVIYEAPVSYVSESVANKTVTLPKLEIPNMKYAKQTVGSTEYAMYEAATPMVRNDKVVIEGKVITDSEWCYSASKAPNKIYPSIMQEKTLYKEGLTLSENILNGKYDSKGTVTFVRGKNINGTSSGRVTANVAPNHVIIHTPVVNKTTLDNSNSINNNQKINSAAKNSKGETAKILVLDQTFKLTISNTGTHKNSKGYGTRVYNYGQGVDKTSFAKSKQVRFPFDVYYVNGSEKIFISKNTWYDLNVSKETFEFLLPAWVKEGTEDGREYYIETRVIAENSQADANNILSAEDYNKSLETYSATKKIFVEVVGRLYEFLITGTNDPSWKLDDNLNVSKQPIGQANQNKFSAAYKYALKLGYAAAFDIKTLGTKSDSITIKPKTFWYVDKKNNKLQEVDLYYHSINEKYIKIGNEKDNSIINVNLSNSIRNVPVSEKTDSLRIQKSKYNYTINNNIGTFTKIVMPMSLRMSYNNIPTYMAINLYGTSSKNTFLQTIAKSKVTEDMVINSVGHWYGEYRLPSSTMAIEKGKTANASSNFLKDGYIIVQFDIESNYQNWSYLSYSKPDSNTQWQKEGTSTSVTLPNGNEITIPGTGTAIVYEANQRANNDYESSGTH